MTLEMLSPKELSKLTAIPVRTITRLAQEGKIPAVKVGRQWRFIREDVERWFRTAASNVRHRVLVVDDDTELLELVKLIISKMGHEVVTATGGREALDALSADTRFSLLVLDLQMPEISGVDILKWMGERTLDIATVIFTAYPDSDLMDQALRYSHVTVLKKPCDPEEIRRAVSSVLHGVSQTAAV
jgi:excisionase family DNA binding protein